jgi:general secretion pathway protein A
MYAPFFGLSKEPFSIAPDPRFLFMSEMHREALAHLLYGVSGGGGFVLLTGEIGAGKTTVCRVFLEQIPKNCSVAYIFNPKLTVVELLRTVCDEFGIPVIHRSGGVASVKDYVDPLNAFVLKEHAAGRHCVLIIDEAQSLSASVLEQLRLLTNLETAERKLLQIILIGQPDLRALLARPELEQLAQRVIARYHLPALSASETAQYIRHRLAVAGPQAQVPFDSAALKRIHALTGGVPRRINLLCDRAMLGAYAHGQARVDKRGIEQAASEVFERQRSPKPGRTRALRWGVGGVALGAAASAVLAAVAAWALRGPAGPAPPVSAVAASAPPSAASTAASTAASASVAASAPAAVADEPATVLAAAHVSEQAAWRELARRWNLALGEEDGCDAAARAALVCYRSGGGLGVMRQLNRPVWLTLRDGAGRPAYALLRALGEERAVLQVGERRWQLTLPALATVWRGEFATFWRAPPGWSEGAPSAELRVWLQAQLSRAGIVGDVNTPLRGRVLAFQVAQGLPPDGLAGPITLMQLNRAGGVDEPRLAAAR